VRKHLTYANVVATMCLVLILGGGAAYAANTVFSSDIVNGEVRTLDLANRAVTNAKLADGSVDTDTVADDSLGSRDLRNNAAVQSPDVRNESLSGTDIADQSGVDTCTHGSQRFGELCARSDGVNRTWTEAADQCVAFGLRLPTFTEATSLAVNFDVPGVEESDVFWADGPFRNSDLTWAPFSNENGQGLGFGNITSNAKAVCVTTPTN
jgi:hypothetical protein